ncbi:MAG: ABC transporter permease, partial [Thermoplasmatota archaeon]
VKVEDSKNGVRRMEMRSQEYREFRVKVRNTGSESMHLRFEALLMPLYDPSWYVNYWIEADYNEIRPLEELSPGEEWEYHVTVSSGYLSMKMPYNILVLATETSDGDYNHAVAQQVVVEITGPPRILSLEEKMFNTLWGGGFNYAKYLWIVLLTAVCGSGIIANDLRNNTFTLYFSRPITKSDYMVGKFLALSTILSVITLVPALIIFVARMAFINEPFIYILEHLWLLGGMLIASVVAIAIFSSIAMALSSMTNRGIFAGVGIFGSFIFASIVSDVMVEIFETDIFKVLNINLMMKNLIKPLFGISYNSGSMGFGYGVVAIVCLGLVAASWIAIFYKFNNKEVAR